MVTATGWRLFAALALLAVTRTIAACSPPDPCAGYFGTCLALHVRADDPAGITAFDLDLTGAVTRSIRKPLDGAPLPVTFALQLPVDAAGPVTTSIAARVGADRVATGRAITTLAARQHASVEITLASRTPDCADSFRDGDEADVDCGGSCATRCADGLRCSAPSDCASAVCNRGRCGPLLLDFAPTLVAHGGDCMALVGPPLVLPDGDVLAACPLEDSAHAAVLRFPANANEVAARALGPIAPLVDLAAGDWDGDGVLDLVGTEPQRQPVDHSGLWIFRGDGSGGFLSGRWCSAPLAQRAVLGDWDGDGKLDAAVAAVDTQGLQLRVVVNDGAGGCAATSAYLLPSGYSRLLAADLDADGHLDLVASSHDLVDGPLLGVYHGHGDGTFERSWLIQAPVGADSAVAPLLGDFTGDGALDVVLPAVDRHGAVLLPGRGDGTFDQAAALGTPELGTVTDLAAGDVNLDGRLDLVAACAAEGRVAVATGKGGGRFDPPLVRGATLHAQVSRIAVSDVNGDHLPDVIVTNTDSLVGVLLNASR